MDCYFTLYHRQTINLLNISDKECLLFICTTKQEIPYLYLTKGVSFTKVLHSKFAFVFT